jgi:ABC-type transport system substrate-binding protein
MKDAGYADGVDTELYVYNTDPNPRIAQAIQQDLAAIGIRAQIKSLDRANVIAGRRDIRQFARRLHAQPACSRATPRYETCSVGRRGNASLPGGRTGRGVNANLSTGGG